MGAPAVVQGDRIAGFCSIHLVPAPSGTALPSPVPLPFVAPLLEGLALTVRIGGRPAAVLGSSGVNTPPHVGLHATDPYFAPNLQVGRVASGSPTVRFGGQPAATTSSAAMCCVTPGNIVPTVRDVTIG